MIKGFSVAAAALAGVLAASSGSAASCVGNTCTFTPGDAEFTTAGDTTFPITGAVAATIGRTDIGAGTFTDIYAFIVDVNGTGSGSFSTSLSGDNTNIDFVSVFINGAPVPIFGQYTDVEFAGLSKVPITAGVVNTLVINYTSAGLGSYGGNLTFTPAAVPEPATWLLMVGGFGMVGAALRGKRSAVQFA